MSKEKEIIVPIDRETSEKVERLFYEWRAGQETVAFLMKDKDVRWDVLQNYINVVEVRYAELEMMKDAVSKEYAPIPIGESGIPFEYTFLFDRSSIRYILPGDEQ